MKYLTSCGTSRLLQRKRRFIFKSIETSRLRKPSRALDARRVRRRKKPAGGNPAEPEQPACFEMSGFLPLDCILDVLTCYHITSDLRLGATAQLRPLRDLGPASGDALKAAACLDFVRTSAVKYPTSCGTSRLFH